MKRFISFIFIFSLAFVFLSPTSPLNAESLASKLSGRILLQVEDNGEAWYVNPANQKRYYMGRPDDAFSLMRTLGIGIATTNLEKIPVAEANFGGTDTDKDGVSDMIEDAFGTNKNSADTDGDDFKDKDEIVGGYNPLEVSKLFPIDQSFASKQKGKIFLQVEQHGEAWYINPGDAKRYFLGRPSDAFSLMRSLGLGITNTNLKLISTSSDSALPEGSTTVDQSDVDELDELKDDLDALLSDQDKSSLDDSGVKN